MPVCKDCRNEYWRERYAANPDVRRARCDAVRRSRLLGDYGISSDKYDKMLLEQGNKCKLCGSKNHGRNSRFKYWNVDHDHKTGIVRGLLCNSCNTAIGKYEKLIEKVGRETLIRYLSS